MRSGIPGSKEVFQKWCVHRCQSGMPSIKYRVIYEFPGAVLLPYRLYPEPGFQIRRGKPIYFRGSVCRTAGSDRGCGMYLLSKCCFQRTGRCFEAVMTQVHKNICSFTIFGGVSGSGRIFRQLTFRRIDR